jgi:phosphoribosylamine--glycine ligase
MPALAELERRGVPYRGVLYAGLMLHPDGTPNVVEFNCRLGDPETQPILMRLKSDLFELIEHAIDGTLDTVDVEWDRRAALGVVMAAAGYPDSPRKGDVITGLPTEGEEDVHVFHAGTSEKDGKIVTSGGRVLCVTALGDTAKIAAKHAYEVIEKIRFDGMQFRRDIGHRALKKTR